MQDTADVVAQGEALLQSEADHQVKHRIKFEAHDFFNPQPDHGAAVYLLRSILHDHPDPNSAKILQNIVPVMQPGARLIVMDGILPEPNAMPRSEERLIRIMDMEMTPSSAPARERGRIGRLCSLWETSV